MDFEWDEAKNRSNLQKHGVAFPEAVATFQDPRQVMRKGHTVGEEMRWEIIGQVFETIYLVVFTPRWDEQGNPLTRIISARRASRIERKAYDQASR